MVEIGEGAGRRTVALITAMDSPLGRAVGNALEVAEALEVLAGGGDPELREVSISVAREMCRLAGVSADPGRALDDGSGRERFEAMLRAQGGRLEEGLPKAAATSTLLAETDGWVAAIDALEVGFACLEVGAGRLAKTDQIDPGAGVVCERQVGEEVRRGDRIATIHARNATVGEGASARLRRAWTISAERVAKPPHILGRVSRESDKT
jgi:thymidine phosphorylase